MTVYTLQAAIPGVRLAPGMKLKLEAVHPTTGVAVTGVTASAWAIYGDAIAGDDELDIPVALPLLAYGPGGAAT